MVDKLKAGQTRSQVRFVLGSPLVADMFHNDRWDYVYLMQKQGKPDERRRLTVIFDGDKLLRLEGDVVATDKVLEPAAVAPAKPGLAAPPAPTPEAAKPALKPPAASTPAATSDETRPAAKESADKPGADSGTPQSNAAQSEALVSQPGPARIAQPDASKEGAAKSDSDAANDKEAPKRGLFGRMLDKIGL
jgi:outer membrane protein assembly factor BamE